MERPFFCDEKGRSGGGGGAEQQDNAGVHAVWQEAGAPVPGRITGEQLRSVPGPHQRPPGARNPVDLRAAVRPDQLGVLRQRQYLLLDGNGELARRRALRLRSELLTLVREGIEQRLLRPLLDSPMFAQSLERFQSRTESPYRWAEEFVTQISGGGPGYELHKS